MALRRRYTRQLSLSCPGDRCRRWPKYVDVVDTARNRRCSVTGTPMTDGASSNWLRWFFLILAMFCAGCMWFYVTHIWAAGQSSQFTDLYAPWWGSHEVLLHGRNPYTPAVAHDIHFVIYGAP